MARKRVVNADVGDADHFGGDDIDYIQGYLSGDDQSTEPVTIGTTTTFKDGKLALRNPANTYSVFLKAGAQTASDKTFTFPVTTTDTIVTALATQELRGKTLDANYNTFLNLGGGTGDMVLASVQTVTGAKTFADGMFKLRNPADTFSAIVKAGAQVTADKTFTFPVSASDTIVLLNLAQTLAGKTINATDNTITDTSTAAGDLLVSNGTKFGRRGMGSASTYLRVNSGGTDLEYGSPPGADPSTMAVEQDPTVKRTGRSLPITGVSPLAASDICVLQGALQANVTRTGGGTNTVTLDTTNGLFSTFVSAASSGAFAGLVPANTTSGLCNTTFSGKIRARFKIDSTSSARFIFGLTNNPSLAAGDTPANSISTMLVGFISSGNWQVMHNNNSGSGTYDNLTGNPAKDANWHTAELNWPAGGANFNLIWDGGTAQNIATDVPTNSDPMWFIMRSENTSGTARSLSFKGAWVEFGV